MPQNLAFKLFTLFYLSVSIALFSCKASESNSQQDNFAEIVRSKLGPDYEATNNADNQYVLCVQKPSGNDHARRQFKYIVVQRKDNKITTEGDFVQGYAKWIANDLIEVASSEGISDQTTTRKILVRSQDL